MLAGPEASANWHAPRPIAPTLLRRVTFDLTGLPPTPEELDAFLADKAPWMPSSGSSIDLLASVRYGERWGPALVRPGSLCGHRWVRVRPGPPRCLAVSRLGCRAARTRTCPTTCSCAGGNSPATETDPNDPQSFVATGFNRCYPDMVDLNDQKLRRQNALNDITETTGLVFLGLTVGCARCHDHKFDPIRLSDFYRLQAFFAGPIPR